LVFFFVGVEVLGLWYAQSRGGFLAAIVGIGTMGWIYREQLPRWTRRAVVAAVVAAAAAGLAVIWHPWSEERPQVFGSTLLSTSSTEGRVGYWKVALEVFRENPLTGTGPETFYATYPQNRKVQLPPDGSDPGSADKPHNIFLEYAANTGLLGVGAYVAVVGTALWYGYRRARRRAGRERLLLAAFVGMLAAYLAQASFSIDVVALALMGWLAIGATAAMADPRVVQRRESLAGAIPAATIGSKPRPVAVHGRRVGAALCAVAVLGLGLRVLRADVNAGTGQSARASQLNPLISDYTYKEGLTALNVAAAKTDPGEKLKELERARTQFEKTLDVKPGEWTVMEKLAETYIMWGKFIDASRYADAIAWWEKAVTRDPTNPQVSRTFEFAKARMEKDVADSEAAAAQAPSEREGWVKAAKGRIALGQPAAARSALERVVALDPSDREALDMLANLPG
jgi:tetratricopeptide (TPR) repeat protein